MNYHKDKEISAEELESAKKEMISLLRKYPWVKGYGPYLQRYPTHDESVKAYIYSKRFLSFCKKTSSASQLSPRNYHGSYWWKHLVEELYGHYVPASSLILACFQLDVPMNRSHSNYHPLIGITRSSLKMVTMLLSPDLACSHGYITHMQLAQYKYESSPEAIKVVVDEELGSDFELANLLQNLDGETPNQIDALARAIDALKRIYNHSILRHETDDCYPQRSVGWKHVKNHLLNKAKLDYLSQETTHV